MSTFKLAGVKSCMSTRIIFHIRGEETLNTKQTRMTQTQNLLILYCVLSLEFDALPAGRQAGIYLGFLKTSL